MGSINDRVSVGVGCVLINSEGKFLLSERIADKHGRHTWSFPVGKPDAGESPHEAALRELAEEAGIVSDWAQPLGLWTYERYPEYGIHFATLYFLIDHEDQVPQDLEPHKHSPWEWIDLADAAERGLLLFGGCREVMELLS